MFPGLSNFSNMEMEKIISCCNKYNTEIVKKLSTNGWRHFKDYFLIKENFLKSTLDDDFKNVFCTFYRVNGPMGLNDIQKMEFFRILSLKENSLEIFLRSLYKLPGYGKSHKLFLSFGTKLLHTIDDCLPIYDRNIAYVLELTSQAAGVFEVRIQNRIDIYNELKNDFDLLLRNYKIVNCLRSMRKEIYKAAAADHFEWKDNLVSDTKLLDSSLWALYGFLRESEE